MNRITACEMKFMRRTAGQTKLDHKGNQNILDKLTFKSVIDYIQNYQRKWTKHVNKRNRGRILKQILSYQRKGQRLNRRSMKSCEENMRPQHLAGLIILDQKKKSKRRF
jgi:hypothetical protein